MRLDPGARLGSYEIVAPIGAGGMGEVYRARDVRLGRDVAVKTIASELAGDPGSLERFQREARAVATISHPNIVTIHDIGCEGGVWFLVTELLEGETLRARLARGRVAWRRSVEIGIAVAGALAGAHARGIVHRDVKPENVFLVTDGRVKILDFGLAVPAALLAGGGDTAAPTLPRPTQPGTLAGTVAYMSPEQIRGYPADAGSDLFSLGCVLHEMLSGAPAFAGATAGEVLAAILRDAPGPLDPDGAVVPAALRRVVMRCLEKERERRFSSASELVAALRAILESPDRRGPGAPSVAVLPFLDLSADPDNDLFADGVTEDVIAHLAKVRSLKVISRTSVMPFKGRGKSLREIGATLGADTVVEGSVRRVGDRVRIVAQLVDAATDEHLWAETYDRVLDDVFAIQTDVALNIAAALQAELSPGERARIARPPAADLEAYRLYVQGRYCFTRYTREGFLQSIAYFEQAVGKDPAFALAYAAAAHAYVHLSIDGVVGRDPAESLSRARAALERALALDDGLGEAHGVAGLLRFIADFDWAGAEEELRLALELSPGDADAHDAFGWLCSSLGRCDEALAAVRRARELDPMAHRSDVGSELMRAGRYESALEEAERLLEFDPSFPRGHSLMGWAQIKLGRPEEGIAALERAAELSPDATLFRAQLGQAYAMTGAPEKARTILAGLRTLAAESYVSPYHFAYVHAGLGEHEEAIDWLERAFEQRAGAIYGIKGSFLFKDLRDHPRFVALLRRMNLV